METKRTIRRAAVIAKTGLSATTVFNLEREGKFPQHFLLTPRCAVWDEAEVDAWIESRRAARVKAAITPDPNRAVEARRRYRMGTLVGAVEA